MSDVWQGRNVMLRFRVSVRTLGSVRLRVKARAATLTTTETADLEVPSESLEPDMAGYYLPSLPIPESAPSIRREPSFVCYIESRYRRYFIDMNTSFEEYANKFSSKSRATIRRKIRKFEHQSGGEIDYRAYRTPEELLDFYRLARDVSTVSYQEKLLDAGLPDSKKFEKEMLADAHADTVRAFLLTHEGRPVAYLYCPVRDSNLIFSYLGYDPEYAKSSVGTVLQWLALESLFGEQRYRLFDFTEGESEHKRFYSTGGLDCGNVFFLRRTAFHEGLIWAHRSFNSSVEFVRDGLDSLQLRKRLVRLLRTT